MKNQREKLMSMINSYQNICRELHDKELEKLAHDLVDGKEKNEPYIVKTTNVVMAYEQVINECNEARDHVHTLSRNQREES